MAKRIMVHDNLLQKTLTYLGEHRRNLRVLLGIGGMNSLSSRML